MTTPSTPSTFGTPAALSTMPPPAKAAAGAATHDRDHHDHDHHNHDHAGHAHGHASPHRHEIAAPLAARVPGAPRLSLIALSGLQRLLLVAPAIILLWLITLWAMLNGALSNG